MFYIIGQQWRTKLQCGCRNNGIGDARGNAFCASFPQYLACPPGNCHIDTNRGETVEKSVGSLFFAGFHPVVNFQMSNRAYRQQPFARPSLQ